MRNILPEEKKMAMVNLCDVILHRNELASQHQGKFNTIRYIARLLGKISSSFLGVLEGKMHYRKLEKAKTLALIWKKGRYDETIALQKRAQLEIAWWKNNIMTAWAPIVRGNPEVVFTTDAWMGGY